MARRSFAHAEKPHGAGGPQHNPAALNALSALARRGSHNINAEQIQRPMPQLPSSLGQPGPVMNELASRLQAPQGMPDMGQGMPPQGMPPQMAPPMEQPPMPQEEPQPEFGGVDDEMPVSPYPGYWVDTLEQMIEQNPAPKGQADERVVAAKKFRDAYASLERMKDYVRELERKIANA